MVVDMASWGDLHPRKHTKDTRHRRGTLKRDFLKTFSTDTGRDQFRVARNSGRILRVWLSQPELA